MDWQRSSYCGSPNCVEVAFVRSSASLANGSCVEVGHCCGDVLVRNSRDPDGPVLRFDPAEWVAFTAGVAAGEFDPAGGV